MGSGGVEKIKKEELGERDFAKEAPVERLVRVKGVEFEGDLGISGGGGRGSIVSTLKERGGGCVHFFRRTPAGWGEKGIWKNGGSDKWRRWPISLRRLREQPGSLKGSYRRAGKLERKGTH